MSNEARNYNNHRIYSMLFDTTTARQLNLIDVYAKDKADMLKSYYLAKTLDGRRVIDAMNTNNYIDSIAKEIARKVLKSIDKVIKEVQK